MPVQGLTRALAARLEEMAQSGRLKGNEAVISRIIPARGAHGPRYVIEGEDRLFLRMNSNSYLGMGLRAEIIEAEERGADT
jgi:glycine C-acetyltransferase